MSYRFENSYTFSYRRPRDYAFSYKIFVFSNGPVTRCMFSHSWSLDMYAQVEVVFSYKWPLDLNCFRIDFQIFVRFRTDGIVIIRFRIEYLCFRTGL